MKKTEVVTGRDFIITMDGSEADMKAAMKDAFAFALNKIQAGRPRAKKKIGNVVVGYDINSERAMFV